jgi:hypothetical protein
MKQTEVMEVWQFYAEEPYRHILYIFKKRNSELTDEHRLQAKVAAKKLNIKVKDIKFRYIKKYSK